jgi:hypothetical protein
VLGAFDAPVAHLAFDHAWVGPQASFGKRLVEDLIDRLLMGGDEGLGGKIPGGIGCCGGRLGGFW